MAEASVFFLGATVQHIYSSTHFLDKHISSKATLKYVLVSYFHLLPGSLLAVKIAAVEM